MFIISKLERKENFFMTNRQWVLLIIESKENFFMTKVMSEATFSDLLTRMRNADMANPQVKEEFYKEISKYYFIYPFQRPFWPPFGGIQYQRSSEGWSVL